MEALIKIIAIGVSFGSLSIYGFTEKPLYTTRVGEAALMVILGSIFVALVVHRVLDQELFALGFMILQVIGHWMLVMITFIAVDPGCTYKH
jgi:hypothetical protein